jgi:hypothetical protein
MARTGPSPSVACRSPGRCRERCRVRCGAPSLNRSARTALTESIWHRCDGHLGGRRLLRTTGRLGLRRATSANPARSYMVLAPKNMESGWLRSSLSTG